MIETAAHQSQMTREWEQEPDHDHFMAHGLHCVMRRTLFTGAWCGYVGVSAHHPLYGAQMGDMVPWDEHWAARSIDIDEHGALNLFITAYELQRGDIPHGHAPLTAVLTCHGGLSWSAPLRDWTGWFFGFDCAHADDYQPTFVRFLREDLGRIGIHHDECMHDFEVYRNQVYVQHECENLAWQLAQYEALCQLTPSPSKE
jgi:hypothetical protein